MYKYDPKTKIEASCYAKVKTNTPVDYYYVSLILNSMSCFEA